MWRFLLTFGITIGLSLSQTIDDDMFYFTNPSHGNAVWILDESSLPWIGGYQFLRSLSGNPTILLSVVDSSTGVTLGQCVAPHDGNQTQQRWQKFQWQLTSSGLECRFDSPQPIQVQFAPSANPRTFSVRIQSATGPACLREMTVQNEQPVGCPPHLSRNSFTAISLNCSCPYLEAATNEDSEIENEDGDMLSNTPQFPIFKGIENEPSAPTTQWTLSPSPCAGHECLNNGTCLVAQDGKPTCLCRNGFSGDRCESDVCSSVPCQNGGVCRSNSGIAYCECPPSFTGLLCESSNEESQSAVPQCTPECSNGQCLLKNGQPECECRQGFTGSNCNVLDVCLGDAACSMFGPNAKCVLDENMDKMTSTTLMNGTYDCLCPHPVHGQFVECMQLHAPAGAATSTFPILEISKLSIGQTTETTPVVTVRTTQQQSGQTEGQTVGFTVTREPMRPVEITLGTTLPPPFQQHIITAGENMFTTEQSVVEHKIPTQTTFTFPQTPETTTTAFETTSEEEEVTTQEMPKVKFVSPVVPDAAEEEEEEEEEMGGDEETSETFPTPSTMTTDEESTSQEVASTTVVATTTTEEEEEEESEETEPSTIPTTTQTTTESTTTMTTTVTTTEETTTTEMEETTTEEDDEEMEIETTKTSLPFWMTSSTTKQPQPSPTPMPEDIEDEEVESSTENVIHPNVEESAEEMTTTSNEEVVLPNKNAVEVSTPSDITHQQTHNGKQTSAAASWIIAIIALIVLGLLLLATSLFILRYIRQSRKLHGKYNPAREEHNLSAAYAMPMSHIAKEERLI